MCAGGAIMKKLMCCVLLFMLATGTAFAMSIQLTDGAVTIAAVGQDVRLERFHVLGTDGKGNYLIYEGTGFYMVPAETLRKTVTLPGTVPALGRLETLARGAKGDEVVPLQTGLKKLGYLSGSVDGSFGPGTESAVKAFQKANGMEETGEADEITQLLVDSMAGETHYLEHVVDPETLYAPILGKTDVDIQPIMDSGLAFTYSELDGEGFITDGNEMRYDASGSADLDKYELTIRFGIFVKEEGGAVKLTPAMKVSCLCVRRPMLSEVTLKGGSARGEAPVEDLKVRLEGIDTVEEGIVFLTDAMVEALAQSDQGLLVRIDGQYNSFELKVEDDLSLIGGVASEIWGQ